MKKNEKKIPLCMKKSDAHIIILCTHTQIFLALMGFSILAFVEEGQIHLINIFHGFIELRGFHNFQFNLYFLIEDTEYDLCLY